MRLPMRYQSRTLSEDSLRSHISRQAGAAEKEAGFIRDRAWLMCGGKWVLLVRGVLGDMMVCWCVESSGCC